MANLRNYSRLNKINDSEFQFVYANRIEIWIDAEVETNEETTFGGSFGDYDYEQLTDVEVADVTITGATLVTPKNTYDFTIEEVNNGKPTRLKLGKKHLDFFADEIFGMLQDGAESQEGDGSESWVNKQLKNLFTNISNHKNEARLNYLTTNIGSLELAQQSYNIK